MQRPRTSGFSLVELMVVVTIVLVVAAAGVWAFGAQRPRQRLLGAAVDMHALVHSARQTALATGRQTVILVFPETMDQGHRGRMLVWDQVDQASDFFDDASPTNFENFGATSSPPYPGGEIISSLELPEGVTFGPLAGRGAGAEAPMPSPIPLDADCTFCRGADRRGAIAFDSAGTPTFHFGNGTAGVLTGDVFNFGVSLSLMSEDAREMKVLLVTTPTGAVQTLSFELPPTP